MTCQTKLRTNEIIPNENMCFLIGMIYYNKKIVAEGYVVNPT